MTKHDNVSQGKIMKATEFVKEYGIDTARECLEERPKGWESCYLKLSNFELVKYIPSPLDFIDVDDLKRLVESHELVEKLGGLDDARDEYFNCVQNNEASSYIAQAIADVEACQ